MMVLMKHGKTIRMFERLNPCWLCTRDVV